MSDDVEDDGYDYEAAVIAMLTLRINTTPGEWLSDADLEIFGSYEDEAIAADGEDWAHHYMLIVMMNTGWLAIQHLSALTGEPEGTWLQRIAGDLRFLPEQRGDE